jgi:hypothetical protein
MAPQGVEKIDFGPGNGAPWGRSQPQDAALRDVWLRPYPRLGGPIGSSGGPHSEAGTGSERRRIARKWCRNVLIRLVLRSEMAGVDCHKMSAAPVLWRRPKTSRRRVGSALASGFVVHRCAGGRRPPKDTLVPPMERMFSLAVIPAEAGIQTRGAERAAFSHPSSAPLDARVRGRDNGESYRCPEMADLTDKSLI